MEFRFEFTRAVGFGLALLLAACEQELVLPLAPESIVVPVIDRIEPDAAYENELITITGSGFDSKAENDEIRFTGGFVTTAIRADATHVWFSVPPEVREDGTLVVNNRVAASAPSRDPFHPLGHGHPVIGNTVADLRFRHRPVGIVDTPDTVLIASTLFDAVVDDAGHFAWVPGRPVAFHRMPQGGGAILSTRSDAGGRVLDVNIVDGQPLAQSAPSPVVEHFLLPLEASSGAIALSVGVDPHGVVSVSRWTRSGEALVAATKTLDLVSVSGAVLRGEDLYVLATLRSGSAAGPALVKVDGDGTLHTVWEAQEDAVPTGPFAIVDVADGAAAVMGLDDGNLGVVPLAGGELRQIVTISFAPAGAMLAAEAPGHVLLTKPVDGALLQYDVASGDIDWSVQLRGEPSALDIALDLEEVAVANGEDNGIDVVSSVDGKWLGRSSLSLGFGSADGGDGGVVAPYSYDPADPPRLHRVQVLARTAPLVLDLEPNALNVLGVHALDDTSAPLRLAVTPDFRTLVVHEHELGLLDDEKGELVVFDELAAAPLTTTFLRDGSVLVGSLSRVDVLTWNAAGDKLVAAKGLALPTGASLVGLVSHRTRRDGDADPAASGDGDSVLVVWRSGDGFDGGFYDPATLAAGGAPAKTLALDAALGDPTGVIDLSDGPAMMFARSPLPGPALLTNDALRGLAAPLAAVADGPTVTRSTPDGRYILWLDEGAGEHMVRVLQYTRGAPLYPWAGYRLEGHGAGPGSDPSGEWLYVPVPRLDMLSVLQ